jgi:PAS domain S-box-containing protein
VSFALIQQDKRRDTRVDDNSPIYNSRIIKIYLEYLRKYYPHVEIYDLLKHAEMTKYEVEDPAHWFSQRQTDLFQEALLSSTGNPSIPREAGRYAASSDGMGALKQYTLGLMSLRSVYLLMDRVYSKMSRGITVKARKLGPRKVEIILTPKPGVNEKPYQCENRIGLFESVAEMFTGRSAKVEHPSCLHKGDECFRYIITWENTPSSIWKRVRNYSFLIGLPVSMILFFIMPLVPWIGSVMACAYVSMAFTIYCSYLEKKELGEIIKIQGDVAQDRLDDINIRYNNALLVQEIGQVTSTILDINELLNAVAGVMEKRLDFDRGMIMLAGREKTVLHHMAGYGYNKEEEELLRQTRFELDNPKSSGVFVISFNEQKPFLVNDVAEIEKKFSMRSRELAKKLGVQALICVPIIYEEESLGILVVDNIRSKKPFTQSEVSLLMGVASQTAVSMINAMSFQKLQESEDKYRTVLEANPDPVVVYDMEGKVTYFNPAFTSVFGWVLGECLGKKMDIFVTDDAWPETRMMINRVLAGESFSGIETRRYTREGDTIPVTVSGSIYRDSKSNPIGSVHTLRNISENKKLEAQLQRAQKMEAIGTLAGGVAHDLNNILSGIVSYPELLLMDIPQDSPLRKPILTIQKSGERAAMIVQDLLTLARRGVAATEVVNLNHVISEYLQSPEYEKLQSLFPQVQVETRLDADVLNILGSPVHLEKTVMNLVSNAVEAMPDGGKVLISTENRYVDRPISNYDEVNEGDYVSLTVSDTGVGISKGDLERIFEPFYTKKVMGRSGTGLGMAVVWGTLKDHKGYIDVQSSKGKGTTFVLSFPITRKNLARKEALVSIENYMGNEKILIVDDIEEQRDIASGMLKKLGYSVTSVSSGQEAIEYMKESSADLLVLDMIMDPGIDGLETYKRILEFHPGQKAIIASGFSETERVKETQRLGAGGYLKKPYLLEKMGSAVRTELDK